MASLTRIFALFLIAAALSNTVSAQQEDNSKTKGLKKIASGSGVREMEADIDEIEIGRSVEAAVEQAMRTLEITMENLDVQLREVEVTLGNLETHHTEIEIPHIEIPDIEIPEIEMMDIEIPEIEIPEIDIDLNEEMMEFHHDHDFDRHGDDDRDEHDHDNKSDKKSEEKKKGLKKIN